MGKNPLRGLRRFYQNNAYDYDRFIEEEMSVQETKSFLSLIDPRNVGPVLDIAAGTGRISRELTADGKYYVGLDLSDSMLKRLRQKTPRAKIDLACASATQLPFRDSSFGMVTCLGLTGYFGSRAQLTFLSELSRVLIQKGRVAVDYLRPRSRLSRILRSEEMGDGNNVYLLNLNKIVGGIEEKFVIVRRRKTPRQLQLFLRKKSGKD